MNLNLPKVLFADDDADLLRSMSLLFERKYDLTTTTTVSNAKALMQSHEFSCVVVDLCFEGQEDDGLVLMDWIARNRPDTPFIVLSGDSETKRVVEATKRKALVEFVPKSLDNSRELDLAIERALELSKKISEIDTDTLFLTRSSRVKELLRRARQVAMSETDCSVLISGETGAGKEYLARFLAACSKKHLVAANMGSIPKETAESELFGHVKGSFTGAQADKPGLFLKAHRGMFFLDEIGECPLSLQVKLLRAIQEKEFFPVGAVDPRKVDVQFVGATNRDLQEMCDEGSFRLDLLNRLNTITLELPPLRERPEDIQVYTTKFIEELEQRPITIKANGLDRLLAHDWPGNVRELRNFIERFTILSDRNVLDAEEVDRFLITRSTETIPRSDNALRRQLLKALEETNGNRTKAAQLLNVNPSTLFRQIKRLGIRNVFQGKSGRPFHKLTGETL